MNFHQATSRSLTSEPLNRGTKMLNRGLQQEAPSLIYSNCFCSVAKLCLTLCDAMQAVTFTECVGNYTGIDGAYNLCSRTKQPGSQKCWTGHIDAADQGEAALEYQAMVLKNAHKKRKR